MTPDRHFLGWDAPITSKVCNYFLPNEMGKVVDLSQLLVVVPTRQAGRRLREALVSGCAEQGAGLLPPRVENPTYFFSSDRECPDLASATTAAAALVSVLIKADLGRYPALFPAHPPAQDFQWALQTADLLQGLRSRLIDGGYLIRDVVRQFGAKLPEADRWKDLSGLETEYLTRLERLGLRDPCAAMVQAAAHPAWPDNVTRCVLAAVPDPSLLMVQAMEQASGLDTVEVLIHAPESMADHFDEWGRPLADAWDRETIDIPDPEVNVVLAGSPKSQSAYAFSALAGEAERFGPGDVAIGVPDPDVTLSLSAGLAEHGIHTFDPAGKPLCDHPLFQLLDAGRAMVAEGSFSAVRSFLRQAEVLDLLRRTGEIEAAALLAELDEFQNDYMPESWAEIARRVPHMEGTYPALAQAVPRVETLLALLRRKDLAGGVRDFLARVYDARTLKPNRPEDEAFRKVAASVNAALDDLAETPWGRLHLPPEHAFELLVHGLRAGTYYPEKPEAGLDLEGWLELPWNDAPFLIVCGVNEGSVPDGRLADMFLPDSLLSLLRLRCDRDRLARDAYLMRSLIESRRAQGRTCFIAGKTSSAGDPLKPSRLLFRCTDDELLDRAARLCGPVEEAGHNHPASISFPLAVPAPDRDIELMHVTTFRDYLACPFRFLLRRLLSMQAVTDDKEEMDALDFGSMVHHALDHMAKDEAMRSCADADVLGEYLWGEAEAWAGRRFGLVVPLPLHIQLDAARQRLQAAARRQVALVEEGWETVETELKLETEIGGMPIHGTIDRVDRHRDTGAVRIMDYKSSDKAVDPATAHLGSTRGLDDFAVVRVGKKVKRWADLQLPLYHLLLARKGGYGSTFELGYFNLPKAVSEAGVVPWAEFNPDLLASAEACAESVVAAIRARGFWPPAERVQYDDYEHLFHDEPERCFDVSALKQWMAEAAHHV
jgi:ATP-dependent helicase/nuclease subunit B